MKRTLIISWISVLLLLYPPADGVLADRYDDALKAEGRLTKDLTADDRRKPAEVLRFIGVKSGDHVLDVFSGGGYYAHLLSDIVGPEGLVIAQNNSAYLDFARKDIEARFESVRLKNVKPIEAEPNDIVLEDGSLDLVIMALAYHDFYWESDGWPTIDVPAFLKTLKQGLKEDGAIVILDHAAPSGSGHEAGYELHRIDPSLVQKELEAAGFRLAAQSTLLANQDDPKNIPMYTESVRGRTDRFIMKFEKAG